MTIDGQWLASALDSKEVDVGRGAFIVPTKYKGAWCIDGDFDLDILADKINMHFAANTLDIKVAMRNRPTNGGTG